jgi:L-rhamnose mutarotase
MQEPLPERKEGEWWTSLTMLLRMLQAAPAPRRYAFVSRIRPGAENELRQACASVSPALTRLVASSRFRNIHLYLLDGIAYLYFEYAGRSLQADALRLSAHGPFADWRETVEKHFDPERGWESMEEVFHTA